MKRALYTMLGAMTLAISAVIATPAPAEATSICSLATPGIYQLYVDKMKQDAGATYFDGVRGDATARRLDVCWGTKSTDGGTFVLPANVQNDSNGRIFQLGYGQRAGDSGLRFFYADGSPDALLAPVGSWGNPVLGNRYTFSITRVSTASGYRAKYQITDQTDGGSIFWYSDTEFGTGMDRTWWGYEEWENGSSLGPLVGNGDVSIAYMGYNTNLSGTWYYRTDLVNAYGSGANYMHRTANVGSNRTGHIIDWVWNNDGFNVHTH